MLIFVKELKRATVSPAVISSATMPPPPLLPLKDWRVKAKVVYSYTAESSNELSLQVGQVIVILHKVCCCCCLSIQLAARGPNVSHDSLTIGPPRNCQNVARNSIIIIFFSFF